MELWKAGGSLERGTLLLEEGMKKAGDLPARVRGMFVQNRQFDLAPGVVVKDH